MNEKEFVEIFGNCIKRDGADKLMAWLHNSDFFEAPASTHYHGNYEGGLVEHSLNVYRRLKSLVDTHWPKGEKPSEETVAIVALLHDLCKVNFYAVEYRNRKNENGQWEQYPFYVVEDQLPYGHGEKSVYIVSGFMKLTREEAFAIRWHMGAHDEAVKGGSRALDAAWSKYPLGMLLHFADTMASTLDESVR